MVQGHLYRIDVLARIDIDTEEHQHGLICKGSLERQLGIFVTFYLGGENVSLDQLLEVRQQIYVGMRI